MHEIGTNKCRRWGSTRLRATILGLLIPALCGQAPGDPAPGPRGEAQTLRDRIIAIYAQEAAGYTIYRNADHAEKLILQREPAYFWTNPTRAGGQDGAIFVWTCRGRPEVVGTIFSFPGKGPRTLANEFLSLSSGVLDVERTGPSSPTRAIASQ